MTNRPVGYVYMLACADMSYYVGSHRGYDPISRVIDHNEGVDPGAYTFKRRPVELVWCEPFDRFDEMVARERQIKGWSRAKKEALIRMDGGALKALSKRGVKPPKVSDPSRRAFGAPQDEALKTHSPHREQASKTHSPHPEEACAASRLEGCEGADDKED